MHHRLTGPSSTRRNFRYGQPQNLTESLSGQSALMAEIASDFVHDIVLIKEKSSSQRWDNKWKD